MPGTKRLLLNGPGGHLLDGWNMAVDCHLRQVLVDLEEQLATLMARPIAYTVCDSEGGGLPLGQQYLAAQRAYLSYLSRQGYALDDFELLGEWQAVTADPDREVVLARWRDPVKAKTEVRELILMRRVGDIDPTRIYTGYLPTTLAVADPAPVVLGRCVPAAYRQRWSAQERVIRELVNGANLNANFGYRSQEVPNRTIQRHWLEAQARVEVSEGKVA